MAREVTIMTYDFWPLDANSMALQVLYDDHILNIHLWFFIFNHLWKYNPRYQLHETNRKNNHIHSQQWNPKSVLHNQT